MEVVIPCEDLASHLHLDLYSPARPPVSSSGISVITVTYITIITIISTRNSNFFYFDSCIIIYLF